MEIKFLWNGIKVDGKLHRCHYSFDQGFTPKEIAIYAKEYGRGELPKSIGLDVKNESDGREDYFETDHVTLYPGDKFYDEALAAWKQAEKKFLLRVIAKIEKKIIEGNKRPYDGYDLLNYRNQLAKVEAA